jgi:uroporphyrinogen decarboxylase
MRQAGRYLPEYKRIRKRERNFLDLCFNPGLAAEISLQPINRFNFDFIILFCDILVIPYALGKEVNFKEKIGPILEKTTNVKEFKNLNYDISMEKLFPVMETIKKIKQQKPEKELIGFCGGPFTVLTYMIEGGTSKNHSLVKKKIKEEREDFENLIRIITKLSIKYLETQIISGVNIVKVFESWAGLLNEKDYEDFVIKPNKKIQKDLKKKFPSTPIIYFPRNSGENIFAFIKNIDCDILSLDKKYPKELLNLAKKKQIILQGNLDPLILIEGGKKLEDEVKKIMIEFSNFDHIFNLSHGILPTTPIANVEKTINIIRNFNEAKKSY